jgi:hypothetical protein
MSATLGAIALPAAWVGEQAREHPTKVASAIAALVASVLATVLLWPASQSDQPEIGAPTPPMPTAASPGSTPETTPPTSSTPEPRPTPPVEPPPGGPQAPLDDESPADPTDSGGEAGTPTPPKPPMSTTHEPPVSEPPSDEELTCLIEAALLVLDVRLCVDSPSG